MLRYITLAKPEKNRQQDSIFGSLTYEKTYTISVLKAPCVNVLNVLIRNTDTYQPRYPKLIPGKRLCVNFIRSLYYSQYC
jgi:hypothetical protein